MGEFRGLDSKVRVITYIDPNRNCPTSDSYKGAMQGHMGDIRYMYMGGVTEG